MADIACLSGLGTGWVVRVDTELGLTSHAFEDLREIGMMATIDAAADRP